ncbi:MAG: glycosyltransferase, partial [Salinisphaeraceae bacterium]|nr:glycosyltransferase [Salinisphaeraceae bacterium]
MRICHINLARGYRGGERQAENMIRELARRGYEQRAIVRKNEPLSQRLRDVQGLEICAIAKPFFLHAGLVAWADIVQVHEAKGNHLACQGHSLKGTPYVITRRIDKPPTASWLNRRLYRNAAASVAVSNAVRDAMQAKFPDVDIQVLPESSAHLPSNPEQVAAIRERFAGKFLIGHVGALVQRHKGQLTLL